MPYKQRVGGSSPSTPTKPRKFAGFFIACVLRPYFIRSIQEPQYLPFLSPGLFPSRITNIQRSSIVIKFVT
jgi:hypothetical protein